MKSKRLGDYIQLVDKKNKDLKIDRLLGVSIQKKFIESIANISGTDMSNYRVIKRNQFAFSPVTSRNGDKLTVALLKDEDEAILSPAYSVFEVTDNEKLIPEYLFIFLNRAEFDRYTRFNSWGSARETFNWEDMCDVKLPIPSIDEQKKYVAIYQGLLNNQRTYEQSLDDLQLICDGYIENLIKTQEHKRLGNYIEQQGERNEQNTIYPVQGVSNSMVFIETKAKTTGLNFSNYKIVENNSFAYNPSRLNIGSIALRNGVACIVSPMYVVFKIKDISKLLPEYLLLWFKREKFKSYVWFYAFGSVRDTFDFNLMEDVYLPIPDIKVQEAIVKIYHTLETRKRINTQLKETIKPLCPILMRGVIESLEKE